MNKIPLSKGYFAVVDPEDFDRVNAFKWSALVSKHTVYAVRRVKGPDGRRTPVLLHRFILGAAKGTDIDHIDGDGLNNCRLNLRTASRAENSINRNHGKPVRGTFFDKASGKWRVQVCTGLITKNGGRFETEDEAIAAYRVLRAKTPAAQAPDTTIKKRILIPGKLR